MTSTLEASQIVNAAAHAKTTSEFIKWFADTGIEDVPLVGGKNGSLGEMIRVLTAKGVKVPNGFSVTAEAYRYFLRETGVEKVIGEILANLDTRDIESLRGRAMQARQAILGVRLPEDLEFAILEAYEMLRGGGEHAPDVAVRSSATAEDLPDASFAGQQETYLNVQGGPALLDTVRCCFASLFTDRAISYRADKGFDHEKIALSVGVQRMVRSDLAASGVRFTLDNESGFRDAVLINAAAPRPRADFCKKSAGTKEFKLICDIGGGKMVKNVPVAPDDRARCAIRMPTACSSCSRRRR